MGKKPEKPLILVVEDFLDAQEMYSEYLTFSGFRVATASDGEQAIARANELQPDLILMDLSLPVIDGFEFASAGATQEGVWPLGDLPRLRDMLASDGGEVAYTLQGTRDERGRPALRLRVSGTLQLRCQRCLETLPLAVNTDELLVLAATLQEIHAEPADASAPDRVVAGKEMPLRDLMNLTTNETLSRTIMTATTTALALTALLIFGGDVIRGFVFAMLFGVIIGTYSTLYVAKNIVLMLGVDRGDKPKKEHKRGEHEFANIDA